MPLIQIRFWDKKLKKQIGRKYDTDKSIFICNVPGGRLLKKPRKCSFYIYNPSLKDKKEAITDVLYHQAKELVRTYGTREQFCQYFTVLNPDGTYKKNKFFNITIDEAHRIKLWRSASYLGMTPGQCVAYLIDKYDDMDNFNKSGVTTHKANRIIPVDLTKLTD